MDLYTIILPIFFLLVAVIFLLVTRKRKPKPEKANHTTRQERAVWAWARVLASEHGPVGLGGMLRVKMKLEIHLRGDAPYEAETLWLVEQEALGYVEVGKEVPVKVDPTAPQFIYPNGAWAKFVE